jgi:uncharacterized tellurite resistance protein B-like protein
MDNRRPFVVQGLAGRMSGATMIRRIFTQLAEALSATGSADADEANRQRALRVATAVLMVNVARADHVFDESEFDSVLDLVQSHFGLEAEQAAALFNAANEKVDDLVSVHEFTQLLHENLDEDEKARIVAMLWRIAYADGRLDKFEDALVLKIGDLLYVSRGLVMRLKDDAAKAAG